MKIIRFVARFPFDVTPHAGSLIETERALCDEIVIIAAGQVAMHDSAEGIRERTGCRDLEDAFVRAIEPLHENEDAL